MAEPIDYCVQVFAMVAIGVRACAQQIASDQSRVAWAPRSITEWHGEELRKIHLDRICSRVSLDYATIAAAVRALPALT